ncbi:MAG: histidine phosphatase family protein, partial [Bacillota bacterium]
MRIYFIRHADPDYENQTITENGHQEAEALAEKLKDLDINKIYCSPLSRAKHTMQYTAEALAIKPEIEEWLQEVYEPLKMKETDWGTLGAWDIPGEEIRKNRDLLTHKKWEHHPIYQEKAEDIKDTYHKIVKKSDELLKRHGYQRKKGRYKINKSSEDQIAVFAHGGLGLCWLAHLLEISLPLM